eukprot:gene11967-3536_t
MISLAVIFQFKENTLRKVGKLMVSQEPRRVHGPAEFKAGQLMLSQEPIAGPAEFESPYIVPWTEWNFIAPFGMSSNSYFNSTVLKQNKNKTN